MKSLILLALMIFAACSFAADKNKLPTKWTKGGRVITLTLGPELIPHTIDTASYYTISPSPGSDKPVDTGSFISKEYYFDAIIPQIFVSPTGKTVLIQEDASDASPHFQYILIYYDSHLQRDWVRHLAFSRASRWSYEDPRPEIVSMTDEKVTYRLDMRSKQTKTSKFEALPDAETNQ
jgi:hypothetical protein